MEPIKEQLWTQAATAKYLNISVQTLTRLGDAGEIARYRIGEQWRYAKADIDAYLSGARQPAMARAEEAVETANRG